jgi:hypothetical protein
MKTTILTLAAAAVFTSQSAFAEVCMDIDEMHAALVDWYAEAPTGLKKDAVSSTTQLWTSVQNDTWTLVRYYPTSACVAAQGTNVNEIVETPQQIATLVSAN